MRKSYMLFAAFVLSPALAYAEPTIEGIAESAETQVYEMRTDLHDMPVLTPLVNKAEETEKIPPSRSYSAIFANNDGSVTIAKPVFKSIDGKTGIPFNPGYSNLSGICRLYGYNDARTHISPAHYYPLTADINAEGRFSGYTTNGLGIELLICGPAKGSNPEKPAPEERAESVSRNDDGSFTVYRPYILGPDNSRIEINSAYSDKTGVCRYFGFDTYVANIHSAITRFTIDINGSGQISGATMNAKGIESIVCRK